MVNYLAIDQLLKYWTKQDKAKSFFTEIKNFVWDDPCTNQIVRQCILERNFEKSFHTAMNKLVYAI